MEKFTQEELKNLQIFMNRVDIKGQESLAHAILSQKIAKMITPKEEAKEVEKVTE